MFVPLRIECTGNGKARLRHRPAQEPLPQPIRVMDDVHAAIARDGSSASLADRMASFSERETAVDTAGYLPRDARYAG